MAKEKTEYVKCPKCGNEMPKGSAFCSACGSKIEEQKIEFVTCKHCGNQTPALSIFCMHCGSQLKRTKKQKDKKEIYVPEPWQRASGNWFVQLRVGKKSYCITKPTYAECKAEAMAVKNGLLTCETPKVKMTLKQACRNYIDERKNILSPSTIAGYEDILRNRFKGYTDKKINEINFQQMLDDEKCSAKTLKNSWIFIKCAIKNCDKSILPEKVTLPQVVEQDLPWLDAEQIKKFLEAVTGKKCEMGALLGLHGLRKSEILAVTPEKICNEYIYVEGSKVTDKDGKIVEKETNKNVSSRRKVPVLIPRLNELLKEKKYEKGRALVSPYDLYDQINEVCQQANLPQIGVHGLRRSFVSLCYSQGISERICMAWGGWSDITVMHKKYIKLSGTDNQVAMSKIRDFYNGKNNATENATKNDGAQ